MSSHSLSFSGSSAFKGFITTICSDAPVTFVLGAGVSIEAGLPSWESLLEQLALPILRDRNSSGLYELICAEEPEPTRRAEMILEKRSEQTALDSLHNITAALYKTKLNKGGALLSSLAKLLLKLNKRVKVITTNYDDCLEYALREAGKLEATDIKVFGIDDFDAWSSCDGIGILHIHGLIPRGDSLWGSVMPVILTEGQYIEYGARVQDIIRRQAECSHCIFVGSSLTDANTTHPLSSGYRAGDIKQAFALMVPSERSAFELTEKRMAQGIPDDQIPEVDDLVDAYFDFRLKHINNVYRTSVIRLKSYSQVTQCIQEAIVALNNPSGYMDDDPKNSSRYGFRLGRIMRYIYNRFDIKDGGIAPGNGASVAVSDALENLLTEIIKPKLDSLYSQNLEAYRKSMREKIKVTRVPKEKLAEPYESENFGLHLWLRVFEDGRNAPFEVFLVGSSSYSRRDGNIMTQCSPISWRSVYASARSVYSGSFELLSPSRNVNNLDRPWNMYMAVPIAISERDLFSASSEGRVIVGALVLQTSKYDMLPGEEFDCGFHSILSLISSSGSESEQLNDLGNLLSECGADLVKTFNSRDSAK
ncbi:hypothetical protein GWK74_00695 [Candidatus Saccharibacteria bacterium oral taxon 488]|nr:hypothetical protein GWK74_00695 [Candidatus Saccharibacteria bacterium oral taxon 488]